MTSNVRVLTYNVQMRSWAMEVGAQGSLTPYTSVEERAKTIAARILGSPQDYDVLCFQEVFDEDGREIFESALCGKYPYCVNKCDWTGITWATVTAGGAPLNIAVPGTPWLTSVAGVAWPNPLGFKFEDSGLMLFSRLPFDEMPTPPDLLGWVPTPTVPAIAFVPYIFATSDDAAAAKGVLYARLLRDSGKPLHLLTSHTQADSTAGVEEHKVVRRAQFQQAYDLLGTIVGDVGEAEVLLVGDLNVDGMAHRDSGYRQEWRELFDTPGSHFTDDLLDIWVREQCPGVPGAGRTPLPDTFDRGMTAANQRLDYAIRGRGPTTDRMVLQHLCIAYEIAQDPAAPSVYTSDHLPLRVDLDLDRPHATAITAEPIPISVAAPDQIVEGLIIEGQMRWYRVDERGGYRLWLSDGAPRVQVDVYTADNLSVPVKPFTTLDDRDGAGRDRPSGTRYALPSAPFFLRVHLGERRGEAHYEIRLHRYTGTGPDDAIPLLRGIPETGWAKLGAPHSLDNPATPWSEHDAVWFVAPLDTEPDGSLEVTSTVTVEDPATRAFDPLLLGRTLGGNFDLVEEAPGPDAVAAVTAAYSRPMTGYVLVRRHDGTFTAPSFTVTLRSDVSYLYGNPGAPRSRARAMARLFCVDETDGVGGNEWGSDDIQVNVTANGIVRVHIPNSDYLEFDDDSLRDLPQIDVVRYTGEVKVELVELDDLSPVDRASVSIPQFDALGPDARISEGDASSALARYAIVFDRDDDDGVYDLTVTVSAEPPGQL